MSNPTTGIGTTITQMRPIDGTLTLTAVTPVVDDGQIVFFALVPLTGERAGRIYVQATSDPARVLPTKGVAPAHEGVQGVPATVTVNPIQVAKYVLERLGTLSCRLYRPGHVQPEAE